MIPTLTPLTAAPALTADEFEAWVQEQTDDTLWEYIQGEAVEVSSNSKASNIGATVGGHLFVYLLKHKIGYATGANGGYHVKGDVYLPDLAYVSYEKSPAPTGAGYEPFPPDLVVEVISNDKNAQEMRNLRLKITNYLADNVIVWVINPITQTLEIHQAGQAVRVLQHTDTLNGGPLLPEFTLPLSELFPQQA